MSGCISWFWNTQYEKEEKKTRWRRLSISRIRTAISNLYCLLCDGIQFGKWSWFQIDLDHPRPDVCVDWLVWRLWWGTAGHIGEGASNLTPTNSGFYRTSTARRLKKVGVWLLAVLFKIKVVNIPNCWSKSCSGDRRQAQHQLDHSLWRQWVDTGCFGWRILCLISMFSSHVLYLSDISCIWICISHRLLGILR